MNFNLFVALLVLLSCSLGCSHRSNNVSTGNVVDGEIELVRIEGERERIIRKIDAKEAGILKGHLRNIKKGIPVHPDGYVIGPPVPPLNYYCLQFSATTGRVSVLCLFDDYYELVPGYIYTCNDLRYEFKSFLKQIVEK